MSGLVRNFLWNCLRDAQNASSNCTSGHYVLFDGSTNAYITFGFVTVAFCVLLIGGLSHASDGYSSFGRSRNNEELHGLIPVLCAFHVIYVGQVVTMYFYVCFSEFFILGYQSAILIVFFAPQFLSLMVITLIRLTAVVYPRDFELYHLSNADSCTLVQLTFVFPFLDALLFGFLTLSSPLFSFAYTRASLSKPFVKNLFEGDLVWSTREYITILFFTQAVPVYSLIALNTLGQRHWREETSMYNLFIASTVFMVMAAALMTKCISSLLVKWPCCEALRLKATRVFQAPRRRSNANNGMVSTGSVSTTNSQSQSMHSANLTNGNTGLPISSSSLKSANHLDTLTEIPLEDKTSENGSTSTRLHDQSIECKVCFEPSIRTKAMGCGHLVCENCLNSIKLTTNRCPFASAKFHSPWTYTFRTSIVVMILHTQV